MAELAGFAFSEAALSALERIPKKFRPQIVRKAKRLIFDPHPSGSKKLEGATDGDNSIYRIRSGDYRILYAVRPGPNVVILDIGDRKDVYRNM